MKNKKYLPLYEKWARNNFTLPGTSGLCSAFRCEGLSYFTLEEDGYMTEDETLEIWNTSRFKDFNTLRQTIVLFMAAMNDEL